MPVCDLDQSQRAPANQEIRPEVSDDLQDRKIRPNIIDEKQQADQDQQNRPDKRSSSHRRPPSVPRSMISEESFPCRAGKDGGSSGRAVRLRSSSFIKPITIISTGHVREKLNDPE